MREWKVALSVALAAAVADTIHGAAAAPSARGDSSRSTETAGVKEVSAAYDVMVVSEPLLRRALTKACARWKTPVHATRRSAMASTAWCPGKLGCGRNASSTASSRTSRAVREPTRPGASDGSTASTVTSTQVAPRFTRSSPLSIAAQVVSVARLSAVGRRSRLVPSEKSTTMRRSGMRHRHGLLRSRILRSCQPSERQDADRDRPRKLHASQRLANSKSRVANEPSDLDERAALGGGTRFDPHPNCHRGLAQWRRGSASARRRRARRPKAAARARQKARRSRSRRRWHPPPTETGRTEPAT